MNKLIYLVVVGVVAISTACVAPGTNTPNVTTTNANANANSNANVAARTAAPTKETLTALETKAFEAWKNKDAKFFEGFMSKDFVTYAEHGERPDRAAAIKMIAESKCVVKNFALSDQIVTPVTSDVAVLTVKATTDYTCDGKTGPSPVISATVYVREGDAWKAAYHNEVPITEPKNAKPAAKTEPAKTAPAADPKTGDSLTTTLTAVETAGWEAWKARDVKKLEEFTAREVTFVNIFGMVSPTKADTIKAWTAGKCDVRSVAITNSKAVQVTPNVAILTYKGESPGTCDGMELKPLWGTTVFVKEGESWKTAYMFETPA